LVPDYPQGYEVPQAELISLVQRRAEAIDAELQRVNLISELEEFRKLHSANVAALEKGQFVVSHEIIRDIHTLLDSPRVKERVRFGLVAYGRKVG
jgi:hypothetical protein